MDWILDLAQRQPLALVLGAMFLPTLVGLGLVALRAARTRADVEPGRASEAAPPAPAVEPAREAPTAAREPEPPLAVEPTPPPAVEPTPPPAVEPTPPLAVEPTPPPAVEPTPPPAVEPTPPPAVEPAPTPAVEPTPPAPRAGLAERLRRTRAAFVGRIEGILGGRTVDNDLLDELEALLFAADLGVGTAEGLLQTVRKEASGADGEAVRDVLRDAIAAKLARVEPPEGSILAVRARPHVILVLGVNGSGKTTTIGKLAARYRSAGHSVILGAGDTFRAAAIEQLQVWGERVGCEVIASQEGGDPAAVAFDTLKAAVARGHDVAIIDTAGRLQTKEPLVEELRKIHRVIGREVEGAPHEVLLVLDGNTGQNALSQARIFTEATGVTGLVVTKLDGTAKGGVIVGLADAFGIPVQYIGVGEAVEDLRDFAAEEFVAALFSGEDALAGPGEGSA